MSVLYAALLGALQGLTEFLPVSSSGHLVLGAALLGLVEPQLLFDVALHAATLVATVVFYRRALVAMARDTIAALADLRTGTSFGAALAAHDDARLLVLIIAGSVPTALIGGAFHGSFAALFGAPTFAAAMLLVTAALLASSAFAGAATRGSAEIRLWHVLLIGTVQGLAIIPGISRSGSTIACALLLGFDRELAARYSFLLAIPAVAGAILITAAGDGDVAALPLLPITVGFVTAAMIGVVALALLIPIVRRGRLYLFAPYLVIAGIAGLVLL